MKFTKENVELAFYEFMHDSESIADLKENIMNLVDEPEKVVVPKFVAEWLAFKKTNKDSLHVAIDGDWQIMPKAMKDWLLIEFNDEVFARAWLDGYTIGEERMSNISKKFHEFVFEDGDMSGIDCQIKEVNNSVSSNNIELNTLLDSGLGKKYFYECMKLAENVIISFENEE